MDIGLGWRLPLYKRYFFYFSVCQNFREIINYDRKGVQFTSYKFRNQTEIQFINIKIAHYIFREIWYEQVYTLRYQNPRQPQVVVDIGANIGFFINYAKYKWPKCKVFAYEPSFENFKILKRNVENSHLQDVFVYNMAISKESGEQDFFIKEGFDAGNSIFEDLNDKTTQIQKKEVVKTVSLEHVLEKCGGKINFLKMDCEGCEWFTLDTANILEQIDYIAMEYHVPPEQSVDQVVGWLKNNNFDCFVTPSWDFGTWKLGMLYAQKRKPA